MKLSIKTGRTCTTITQRRGGREKGREQGEKALKKFCSPVIRPMNRAVKFERG